MLKSFNNCDDCDYKARLITDHVFMCIYLSYGLYKIEKRNVEDKKTNFFSMS